MSKGELVDKTIGCFSLIGQTVTEQRVYWLQVNRHKGGRSFTQAFIGNVRTFVSDVKGKGTSGVPTRLKKKTEADSRGGLNRSSVEIR